MIRREMSLVGTVLTLLSLLGTTAKGATYYVAKSGNDANACSQAQPCLTINRAKTLATLPGDIVQVGPGVYNERITLTTSGSTAGKITFRGQDGSGCPTNANSDINSRGQRPAPTVTMQGFAVQASYVAMQCFKVTGTSSGAFTIAANTTDIDITDNFVDASANPGNPSSGVSFPVITHSSMPANVYVARNYVTQTVTGFWVMCKNNCVFEDNEAERMNGGGSSADHDYSDVFGEHITFRHNYFHGNNFADCPGGLCHIDCWQTWNLDNSGGYQIARNVILDRNVCFNAHEAIIVRDVSGSPIGAQTDWTVTNNVMAHGPIGSSMPWCALFDHVGKVVFEHNTCASGIVGYVSGTDAIHRNNIHFNDGWQPYGTSINGVPAGAALAADHNLLYDPSQTYSATIWSKDIRNQNPLFANATADNYRLQPGSPAIDGGVNVGSTVDLAGNSRPQGAGYDIGAYEYGSGGTALVQPPANLIIVVR